MMGFIGFRNKLSCHQSLTIITVLAIAAFLVVEIWDGDIWWQVAIGRHILSNGVVPQTDLFTAAGFDRPYHDSHWLFQVVMALADKVWGMNGVQIVMIALWGVIFFVCYKSIHDWIDSSPALPVLFLVSIACSGRFTPRPDLVSFLMVSVFYFRLQKGRFRTLADQLLLVFMQVLWNNSHGLFVLGPFMVGCYFLSAFISSGWQLNKDLRRLGGLFLAVILATALTPLGIEVWSYAYLLFKEGGLNTDVFFSGIEELKSPFNARSLRYPDVWIFILLLGAFIGTLFVAGFRRILDYGRLLIVLVFALLAVKSLRSIPYFALTAAPFMAELFSKLGIKLRIRTPAAILTCTAMALIAVFPVSGMYYRYMTIQPRFGLGVAKDVFPEGLPRFLNEISFKGNFYNAADLGGFCLYHGFTPLFDTRWEVYLPDLLRPLWTAPDDQPLWEAMVNHYHLEGLLLKNGSRVSNSLVPRLIADPAWKLVYIDRVATFWLRNSQTWEHVLDLRYKKREQ